MCKEPWRAAIVSPRGYRPGLRTNKLFEKTILFEKTKLFEKIELFEKTILFEKTKLFENTKLFDVFGPVSQEGS